MVALEGGDDGEDDDFDGGPGGGSDSSSRGSSAAGGYQRSFSSASLSSLSNFSLHSAEIPMLISSNNSALGRSLFTNSSQGSTPSASQYRSVASSLGSRGSHPVQSSAPSVQSSVASSHQSWSAPSVQGRVASRYRPCFRREAPVPVSNEAAPPVPSITPQERVKNAINAHDMTY